MNHIGLFEGIGGFSLAASWMGWKTIAWCEWNKFGQKILKHHFPNATGHGDITKTDFTIYRGKCDILTGGFPCQPYSTAGKRLGKEDDRHLWPEMLRAIREIQPRWVVGENVSGLISWNGGMVFNEVQADLEAEGYEVQPFLLPACAVNAPHRRDRIWFVAYREYEGCDNRGHDERRRRNKNNKRTSQAGSYGGERRIQYNAGEDGGNGFTYNTSGNGIQKDKSAFICDRNRNNKEQTQIGNEFAGWAGATDKLPNWSNFPTQSPVCSGDDGISDRLDGITFSKWRNESIKAYGNAIVPQIALKIFKAIQQIENLHNGIYRHTGTADGQAG